MNSKLIKYMLLLALLSFLNIEAVRSADSYITVNSINHPAPGYMFLGDGDVSNSIFNNYGNLIDSAKVRRLPAGLDFRFQSSGVLTFCDPRSAKYYSLDKEYNIVDTFYVRNGFGTDVHEFILNADGSYFLLAIEKIQVDMSKLVANGKPNAIIDNEIIQKYNSQNQLVWSWSCYENLPIMDCVDDPSEVDLTQVTVDPYHVNSLDVDTDGNLLVSLRNFNELLKINPNDNKIIWRMGGSKSKNNQFDFVNDNIDGFTGFSHTHDAKWLDNGNLLVFDNGNTRTNKFSRAVEYKVTESTKKVEKVWEYSPTPKIYAPIMCGAQRLENGNTFITFGNFIFEADKYGNTLFNATKTGGLIYRGYKYQYKMFSVQKDIAVPATVDFNEVSNNTSATVTFNNVETPGYMSVSRYPYKPERYVFQDLEPSKIINQRWVVESSFNFIGKMSIDLNSFSDYDKSDSIVAYIREDEDKGSFIKIESVHSKITGIITLDLAQEGEIILASYDQVGTSTLKIISPRNGDIVSNKTNFTWYKIPSAQYYEFQLSPNNDFSQLLVNELSLTSNTYTVSNLENVKSYYFRARAKLGSVTSKWSEVWQIKVLLATPKQLLPINNAKKVLLDSKLNWNKVFAAKDYQVQVCKDSLVPKFVLNKFNLTDTTLTLDSLNYYTKYFWRVRANTTDVKSNWSAYTGFRTELAIPEIKQPVINSTVSSSVVLDFDRATGIDFYQAMVSNDSTFVSSNLVLISAKQQTATLNLASNKRYHIKLRALALDDTSRWSEPIAFNTVMAKPKQVIPLNNDIIFTDKLDFKIVGNSEATSYELNLVSEDADKGTQLFDSVFTFSSVTFSLDGIQFNTRNNWRVRAVNDFGKSNWTEFFSFVKMRENNLQTPTLLLPIDNKINASINGLLTWNLDSKDLDYKVEISESESFDSIIIDKIISEAKFYYSNLKYGTKYYWRIASTKDNNFSKWSEVRNFTTKSINVISAPNLILPKMNDTIDINAGQFVWENLSNAESYHFQIAYDESFANVLTDEANLKSYEYTESKLNPGKKYYWRVQAKYRDSLNYGEWSEVSFFSSMSETNVEEEIVSNYTQIDLLNDYGLFDYLGKEINIEKKVYENINELEEILKANIYFLIPKNFEKRKKVIKIVTY